VRASIPAVTGETAAYYDVARKLTGGVLQRLKTISRPKPVTAAVDANPGAAVSAVATGMDARTLMKIRVHNELIRTVDLKKLLVDTKQDENKEKEVHEKKIR
jgi:septum site-determining protein MinD